MYAAAFAVAAAAAAAAPATEAAAQRLWLRRVAIAWPLALVVAWLAMLSPFGEESWARWTEFALTTPVQLYVGWPFIREAGRRARRFTANMDTLIAIGTLAAYLFSTVQLFTGGDLYFETAALIIAFLVLGRYFEARAKSRAGKAIAALLELGECARVRQRPRPRGAVAAERLHRAASRRRR